MLTAHKLAPLGFILALSACETAPDPAASMIVMPGNGKTLATFEQDNQICRNHATTHTGYQAPPQPQSQPNPNQNAAPKEESPPPDLAAYFQCMAARGDTVRPNPSAYAATAVPYGGGPYGYDYPYAYGYPYSGAYPYGFGYPGPIYGGLIGGFGWGGGWRHGWHGGWHGGGGHGGGWHGGGGVAHSGGHGGGHH